MFGFGKKKYKHINLDNEKEFIDIFNWLENSICTLYRADFSPLRNDFEKIDKNCLDTNVKPYFVGRRLFLNDRCFDMGANKFLNKDIDIYLGDMLIIKLPRGYGCNYIYYCLVK